MWAAFGPLLRGKRLSGGLTQEELARRAGLSVRTVSDLERGIRRPHLKTVALLANAVELAEADHAELRSAARPQPGLTGGQPPAAGTPRQLPAAPTRFTGRSAELKSLAGLLERDNEMAGTVVVSTIGGTAGVGKTALAVH